MVTAASGTSNEGDKDDIIRLLDQPVSASLCGQTTTVQGRRVPTCALIMLSVVGAIGLLAYFVWPNRADAPQPWKTREIVLPNGAGSLFHRDRVVDSFFGKFERRIDINSTLGKGTVWLPRTERGGSTQGDFVWHEAGAEDSGQGPWLEINDLTSDYLIDMRNIVLYEIVRVGGELCAINLGATNIALIPDAANAKCATVRSGDARAINISGWAKNWSSEHLGLLDRRPQFVPGESFASARQGVAPNRKMPKHARKVATAPRRRCASPAQNHVLRSPPRLEYIGVSERSRGSHC